MARTSLFAIAASASAVFLSAQPTLAQETHGTAPHTQCAMVTEMVSTVGGALTGGSTNQIWIVQQCVDANGVVTATAQVCEMDDDIDPREAPSCSAAADISTGLAAPTE